MEYQKIKPHYTEIPHAQQKLKKEEEKRKKLLEIKDKYREQIIEYVASVLNHRHGKYYSINLLTMKEGIGIEEYISDNNYSKIVFEVIKPELRGKGYKCKLHKEYSNRTNKYK